MAATGSEALPPICKELKRDMTLWILGGGVGTTWLALISKDPEDVTPEFITKLWFYRGVFSLETAFCLGMALHASILYDRWCVPPKRESFFKKVGRHLKRMLPFPIPVSQPKYSIVPQPIRPWDSVLRWPKPAPAESPWYAEAWNFVSNNAKALGYGALAVGAVVATGVLIADDATGFGAVDDPLIPVAGAAACSFADSAARAFDSAW